ncbi:MAG: hypothetical protein K0R92_825 [Lachnospiraceae bacterium]|jgi:hypothetical protein|nr:hypothetical protein [Lachnospiraceae bacterium]
MRHLLQGQIVLAISSTYICIYNKGDRKMRILQEETIALVIDYQEKLVPVMHKEDDLIQSTEIFLRGLEVLKIPSIVTQQYTKGIGMTVKQLQDVYADNFTYFDKSSFSCLDDEIISAKIREYNKKNIIICGIEAHVCVLQTAIDCIGAGYQVIIVEDCISSRRKNDKKIALQRAAREGVVLTTYESLLFELTRRSGNDTFKQISKLIK